LNKRPPVEADVAASMRFALFLARAHSEGLRSSRGSRYSLSRENRAPLKKQGRQKRCQDRGQPEFRLESRVTKAGAGQQYVEDAIKRKRHCPGIAANHPAPMLDDVATANAVERDQRGCRPADCVRAVHCKL